MGVGVGGVVNYANVSSGTASDVVAYGGIGGPYEYVSFFSVLNWFAAGEQGAWYDPSDLTTLFQDSAGTTPVTLSPMEQPVGLMLDKSKGLALGSELYSTTGWTLGTNWSFSGQNLVYSGSLSDIVATSALTLLQANTWYKYTFTISSGAIRFYYGTINNFYLSSGTYSFYLPTDTNTSFAFRSQGVATTISNISVKQIAGNHASQATAGNRPLLSARVNLLLATATLSTQSVTTVATNYVLAFTGAGTVTLSGTATGVLSAGSNTFTPTAGTLTLTVSGSVTLADLRPTNSGALLPAYQRVNTATDYDTVGFPLYLKCNGSSSAMSTNSINFTATDKMTVVTGVRKLSDALQIMIESSLAWDGNNGTFAVYTGSNYLFGMRGIISGVCTTANYFAPTVKITTLLGDIAATTGITEIIPRINGVVDQTNPSTTSGSGNFGNYSLYLFARAGTSFFLNGNFYGAIIRGAQSDTASVVQTENYMAKQTGITF